MAAINKIAINSPSRQNPSELETAIAGALFDLESNTQDLKATLRPLQFVSAREVRMIWFFSFIASVRVQIREGREFYEFAEIANIRETFWEISNINVDIVCLCGLHLDGVYVSAWGLYTTSIEAKTRKRRRRIEPSQQPIDTQL